MWKSEFPSEPGFYWFWGEPFAGGMGRDYKEGATFTPELNVVEVTEIANKNLMAVCRGQFMSSKSFIKERRQEGWLGYWSKIDLPNLPTDTKNFL